MKKILVVSDTHEAYDLLSQVVALESDSDLIIHSGDFANIDGWDESAQSLALSTFQRTIQILKTLNKPIICVPGNHDTKHLFRRLTTEFYSEEGVFILGQHPIVVSGIRFIGLGGAPPGISLDGTQAFAGFPYRTSEESEEAVRTELLPQLDGSMSVLVTHFPPFDVGKLPFRGQIVEAGCSGLERFIKENADQLMICVCGHLHIQFWKEGYGGTSVLNAGSTMLRNYAVFYVNEGSRVERVEVKSF